ncbi:hypothetical protein FQA39_LY05020 [Lamprigera yunnana]|nr:hypothetical protein FQA39_LY05020 [Lamprigera yunnana]
MDSQVTIDGHLVDLIDDNWRADTLPQAEINVPLYELPDPEADNGDLNNSIDLAKKKCKTEKIANQIHLMRIKNKAIGLKSVPTEDRIYFNVQFTIGDTKELPIFVSQQWTLGKAIDFIANECKATNKNNQSNAAKLRLFHKSSQEIVTNDLSIKLEQLLLNVNIVNGENLILEYVSDECRFLQNR